MRSVASELNNEKPTRNWEKSLLLQATEEFVRLDRPTVEEISRFKELFYPLCLKINTDQRHRISCRLAKCPYTPRSIVLFFAMDHINAARPCLLFSPVLKERDLIELTMKNLPEHHAIIAKREDISLAVVNALLAADGKDRSLLSTLKENPHIAADGKIADVLKRAEVMDETKITNTPSQLAKIHSVAGLVDPGRSEHLSEALLNLASKGGRLGRRKADPAIWRYRDVENETAALLLRSARALNHDAFAYAIKRVCGLETNLTLAAINRKDTGFLAVLLRANHISKKIAAKILLILTPDLGRDVNVLKLILDKYDVMTPETCAEFLLDQGADFSKTQVFPSRSAEQRNSISRPVPATPQREQIAGHSSLSNTSSLIG